MTYDGFVAARSFVAWEMAAVKAILEKTLPVD